MEQEIWLDIKDYSGLYQVSNYGRVRSCERIVNDRWGSGKKILPQTILKPKLTQHGYHSVNLYKNKKYKTKLVHRLVAEAFIPNPYNLPQVNHKDEDKTNNCAENLEWCDAKYNANYGTHIQRVAEHRRGKKMSPKAIRQTAKKKKIPVMQYTLEGEELCYWFSATDCEKETGYDQTFISRTCRNVYPKAYGYLWKYVKKPEV